MRNALLCALAGLAAGFAIVQWLAGDAPEPPRAANESGARPAAPGPAAAPRADTSLSTARPAAAVEPAPEQHPLDEPAAGDVSELESAAASELDGLVAAGFTPARAAAILQREAQLRQAAYAAEYEASGTVRPFGSTARTGAAAKLRAELGDADYERYLEGTGQPHTVVVRDVETDSLAAHAGILPGDEIREYAGERVFNQRELNALMLAGTPGEVVAATVVRDGQTLRLYVTRGPLGLM